MNSLVYIHVPKCGGTSFGSALRLRYFYSQATIALGDSRAVQNALAPGACGVARIKAEYDVRDVMLAQLMAQKYRCISVHARYHPGLHERYRTTSKFVTLLRHPVERFLSHYHYLQRHHPSTDRAATLDAFLDSQDAARLGAQYLFYFGRVLPFETNDVGQAVETAKTALGQFSLIGDLSRVRSFQKALNAMTGIPIPALRRNKAPVPRHPLDKDLLCKLTAICDPDIAIYDHAQTLRQCA